MTARAPGVISGRVRDRAGRAVPRARVFFTGGPGSFPDIAALTDAEGRFSLSAPAPGTYRVGCNAEGFAACERAIEVRGGDKVQLDLDLEKG